MSHTASVEPHRGGRRTQRRRRGVAALVVPVALVLGACGDSSSGDPIADDGGSGPEARSGDAPAVPYGLVSPATGAELAVDPDITVLDVRTPEEFAEGHLEGATMIDFYADTFTDELAALDPDQTYLVYCRSGNRSGQTFAMLDELGFGQVYDLDGGVLAWQSAGLPLVR